MSKITIRGAREHNLDNVDLSLPNSKLICFTGVSGSGKSSLAFDTIYAEGQRRYVESLSSYARQFLGQLPKPDVDQIFGLSPAISISQKTGAQNTRSTVGTVTEIADFLRVLYARVGTGYCPTCGRKIEAQTRLQILEHIKVVPEDVKITFLAPLARNQKGRCVEFLNSMRRNGYRRARIDGRFVSLDHEIELDRQARHSIDVVIDRVVQSDANYRRVTDAVDTALRLGRGRMIIILDQRDENDTSETQFKERNDALFDFDSDDPNFDPVDFNEGVSSGNKNNELYFSSDYACSHCGVSYERPSPQMFSFNNPQGMCPYCQGMGYSYTFDPDLLIPDKSRSFQQGCVVPIGKWQDLSSWKQHIYLGIATAIAEKHGLEPSDVLETAWDELDENVRRDWLWGVGNIPVSYSWKTAGNEHKWNGRFEGLIPKMEKQYHETTNRAQLEIMERFMATIPCSFCHGMRLNEQARAVRLETTSKAHIFAAKRELSLPEVAQLSITDAMEFFSGLKLTDSGQIIARELLKEINSRLGFLADVGLSYLCLGRPAPTLSGGEMQRIRLAGQIGGGLVGALYVLDEPSIGLHPRDNDRLISTLTKLRDLGNSIILVEHDEDAMLAADYLVDFGPGPGSRGGRVVASGTVAETLAAEPEESSTIRFLVGKDKIETPRERRKLDGPQLVVRGARHHNLKNIDVHIPLGGVVCITGVSGSGKSSLVNDILREALGRELNHAIGYPGEHDRIDGVEHLKKLISIDQTPIGRTPRSNPATYIKLFDDIRKLYSETPEARAKGFAPGRFSFNVPGGRCEACEGNGAIKVEMDFLADVWATCSVCGGARFNQDTRAVKFKGLSIDQVLDLEVEMALEIFENIPRIREKLETLRDVGLGYMKLGQPSPTLSGGEAQRVKLAKELAKKSYGKTIYLLDEPTTGLHFADIKTLLNVLHNFADLGNSVLIVEHNLDVIKTADWVIDLGPEGGEAGGRIVAQGTPEDIANCPESHTGRALKEYLERDRAKILDKLIEREHERQGAESRDASDDAIIIRGAREHNLQNVSLAIPRNKLTVCCGPSGSGKSSLAIDVAYAEGRRRYVESLSSYARQFIGQIQKPDVDQMIGISPAIAIEQKTTSRSTRSTVGTITEILDYLRVVFARLGTPYCPDCDLPVGAQSIDEIVARVMRVGGQDDCKLMIMAPITPESGESYARLWERLKAQGFARARVNGRVFTLDEPPELAPKSVYVIEAVVDRVQIKAAMDAKERKKLRGRVASSVETALEWGNKEVRIAIVDETRDERSWETKTLSQKLSCERCGRAFEALTPRHFSFNSPLGRCPQCEGRGVQVGFSSRSLIRDPKLSLLEGAISLWSDFESPTTLATMRALARGVGLPLDTPFERLDSRFRRIVLNGAGERWFDVLQRDLEIARTAKTPAERGAQLEASTNAKDPGNNVAYRFQYKGLYPSLEEAGRLAPVYRRRLEIQEDDCECSSCLGSRLRDDVAAVRFHSLTLDQICRTPLDELTYFFESLELNELEREVAGDLISEIVARLRFLVDVGVEYLTLSRSASTLSGGEAQRIRLASQIGSGLVGVLYVLDEPTIGLHPRDNNRLISAMKKLRDLGNTLLVVEHDQDVIESADFLVDFGPKAGAQGGLIVATGAPDEVRHNEASVTGAYLSGRESIPIPVNRRIMP